MNRIDIEQCSNIDALKQLAIGQYKALSYISETLVDVSKWHITSDEGIKLIRERLQKSNFELDPFYSNANITHLEHITKEIDNHLVHWIDDADHYICPICGFETSSPAKYDGCKCPSCGFQDEKDKQLVR